MQEGTLISLSPTIFSIWSKLALRKSSNAMIFHTPVKSMNAFECFYSDTNHLYL